MSWQPYIDEYLMDSDNEGDRLTAAAIIGHDATLWAKSSSFPEFKEEEIEAIMEEFGEPGSHGKSGLYLGGTKYMVIQGAAGAVIRGKRGAAGVTIKKTKEGLIIGLYDEPMTPGQCNMIVERIGDYVIEQGV